MEHQQDKKVEKQSQEGTENKQVVVFKLEEEEFGIDIYLVREVLKMLPITALPNTDMFIEGVINIRGAVIPVIDLCKRFSLSEERTNDTRIIIVEISGEQVGLIVDAVSEVLMINGENIQPPPSRMAGGHTELLEGVARCDDRLIILLKVENLLSSQEMIDLEEIKEARVEER